MKIREIIFVVLLAGGLLVPAALIGQWWLFATFMTFFVCFGLIEFLADKFSGKTVSQNFWEYSKEHKLGAWIVLGCMLIAWLSLLWHLAAKLL